MLERYFIRPDTVDRIRASWIGEPIERYVGWLTEHRYATRNVLRRVPILVRFGTFAAGQGATRWDELPAHVDAFVADWVQARGSQADPAARRKVGLDVRNAIEQMLTVALPDHAAMNRRPHAPDPFARQAAGFFTYLREERGLRDASIRHYGHFLRGFEGYLDRVDCRDLKDLSPLLLSAFVTESAGHFGRTAMIGLCSAVRMFLSYLRREGVVGRDLAHSVEPPQVYRLAELPRSIAWDEVRRMLETVDRRAPVGRRDYAILLLLVTYGLRAREVASLTLDDIDWKRERLHVRERKADHVAVYPLSPIVGEAILDYSEAGPAADRRPAPVLPAPRAASAVDPRRGVKPGQPLSAQGRHTGAPRRLAYTAPYLRAAARRCRLPAQDDRRLRRPPFRILDRDLHQGGRRDAPGHRPGRRGGAAMRAVNTDLGSPLAEPIRRFVAHKRALNRRFDTEERALRLLDRYLVEHGIADLAGVTPAVLDAFLAGRPRQRPRSYNHLLGVVRRLFDWMVDQEILTASPMRLRSRRETAQRLPYLFDLPHASQLIEAAAALPDRNKAPQRGLTYATIFALLYGLGLRVGEVARLTRADS